MNILGVVTSPRKNGNTEILVNTALEEAKKDGAEVMKWHVSGKQIGGCDACLRCAETGECVLDDDMKELHALLIASDGIILGSPVYFWSVSAQAKTIIDRTLCLWVKGSLKGKIGAGMASARIRGATHVLQTIHGWFLNHGMVVGGDYGGVTTGFCETLEKGSLITSGLSPDGQTPFNDPWRSARQCARDMIDLFNRLTRK